MARSVEDGLRRDYAVVAAVTKAERNRQILVDFNGRNTKEVCWQFNISETTLRRNVGGTKDSDPCRTSREKS